MENIENKFQWFIVNVRSNAEIKTVSEIHDRINAKKLNAHFGEILIPTREVVEVKRGKRVTSEKKFFPGYIVIQMVMNDETFSLVKSTPGVVMFLGQRDKPIPVPEEEVKHLRRQMEEGAVNIDATYEVGQEVHVIDGPFANFNGVVAEADDLRHRMRVAILVFGRETQVDLEYGQVERV
ncbi:MAG: transcription termination/antitermination protein NusG [Rickettsiales bacterium]|jgi:transcriptional antiterminator NusG|nr:transcription termination/antitermination protein NusG [Rickettsiales bacterium]